ELGLARRVDERLDRDVVARPGLPEQLVERAARLDVRLAAGREHLVRLVLRRLYVRLVERVDPEDRARDRGRELPAEELLAQLIRRGEPHPRRLAGGGAGPRGRGGGGRPATRPAPGSALCRPCPSTPQAAARPRGRSRPGSG